MDGVQRRGAQIAGNTAGDSVLCTAQGLLIGEPIRLDGVQVDVPWDNSRRTVTVHHNTARAAGRKTLQVGIDELAEWCPGDSSTGSVLQAH